MPTVIEEDQGVRRVFEKTLPQFVDDDADVLVVNIDILQGAKTKKHAKEIRESVKKGKIVIFYGDDPASVLCRRGHPVVSLLYRANTTYFVMPISFYAIEWSYKHMAGGKARHNFAMTMLAEGMAKRKRVGEFLRDIGSGACDPHGRRCMEVMRMIKKELGIAGPVEKVHKQLAELQRQGVGPYIRKKMEGKIIPGVFCDIDIVGSHNGTVDPKIAEWLQKQAEEKSVIIWTQEDVEKIERLFSQEVISSFPFARIRDFQGCTVEAVISSHAPDKLARSYGIRATSYSAEM